ncbi:N-acetylmuramate alpha-1-phosphate uridylyltransferase [Rhodovastum atsumiense]|uniref:Nucleotidyltransferase family protein n=1 Tax=Rhodovastum atsumiense TaxID=504468 RepID=A0A5M6IRU4_9PROT|nr:nucleotidyltransferase family protein [Rhodovastum atsumiense]KAA5610911.1 nucleotidyltransferase family protein [Rhodovastum atsumiense]CAH2601522.1 N-acetylmuramate alpha-1-phosphate uridylyltransferase [Rhodovastum atsumiense]
MIRPHTAMLLAAGRGTRMLPLTEGTAKPLLPLGGHPLMDHALDRLQAAGVERVVVNTWWHADRIAAHLQAREALPRPVLLREETLLNTGGAVCAAREVLGSDPFFVVNGDSFWLDGPTPALARLAAAWDPEQHDAVLLVHRTFQTQAEVGNGDFALDPWGMVRRPEEREIVPYIFAGIQLLSPTLLADAPEGAFSMNLLWDRAIEAGRVRALVHDGLWWHLSTPADLAEAEFMLYERRTGQTK